MKKYETMFILNSDINEDEISPIIDKVRSIIVNSDGKVENVDLWGKKKLAYEINKKNEGYFVLIDFISDENFPKELDRNFRIMDVVIRHIIVKKN